jgi:hypothetical protein
VYAITVPFRVQDVHSPGPSSTQTHCLAAALQNVLPDGAPRQQIRCAVLYSMLSAAAKWVCGAAAVCLSLAPFNLCSRAEVPVIEVPCSTLLRLLASTQAAASSCSGRDRLRVCYHSAFQSPRCSQSRTIFDANALSGCCIATCLARWRPSPADPVRCSAQHVVSCGKVGLRGGRSLLVTGAIQLVLTRIGACH